jgi:hypothetical protein
MPIVIGDGQPFLANQSDQDVTRARLFLNELDKVDAGLNRGDIHKYSTSAKMASQAIV